MMLRQHAFRQKNIRRHTRSSKGKKQNDNTDVKGRKDAAQSHDYKGKAQNINDDRGRPLSKEKKKTPGTKPMKD
jgi:hypothetical protein